MTNSTPMLGCRMVSKELFTKAVRRVSHVLTVKANNGGDYSADPAVVDELATEIVAEICLLGLDEEEGYCEN